jgi:hypothetical protein
MIIIHNKDGSRTVMTYEEAVAGGYIKQPKVTWSKGIIEQKAQEK